MENESENLIAVGKKLSIFEDNKLFDEGIVRSAKVLNHVESKIEVEMILFDSGRKLEFLTFSGLNNTRNQEWFLLFKDPLSEGTCIQHRPHYTVAIFPPVV